MAFYVPGTTGLVWCFLFYVLIYSTPEDHPRITKGELEFLRGREPAKKRKLKVIYQCSQQSENYCIFSGSLDGHAEKYCSPCSLDNSSLLSIWLLLTHHQPISFHQRSSWLQSFECPSFFLKYNIDCSALRMVFCPCFHRLVC